MRRWQVVTVAGFDSKPYRRGLAWTRAGAWRKAHRLWRTTPGMSARYACGNRLPTGFPQDRAVWTGGWVEVRKRRDNLPTGESLARELEAIRSEHG